MEPAEPVTEPLELEPTYLGNSSSRTEPTVSFANARALEKLSKMQFWAYFVSWNSPYLCLVKWPLGPALTQVAPGPSPGPYGPRTQSGLKWPLGPCLAIYLSFQYPFINQHRWNRNRPDLDPNRTEPTRSHHVHSWSVFFLCQ